VHQAVVADSVVAVEDEAEVIVVVAEEAEVEDLVVVVEVTVADVEVCTICLSLLWDSYSL